MIPWQILSGGLTAASIAAAASWWYYSPYPQLRELHAAAEKGDKIAFNEHVDYERLKESIRGQLNARLARDMSDGLSAKGAKSAPEAAGQVIGTAIGMQLIDPMINMIVTPEVMMGAVKNGNLTPTFIAASAPASGLKWTIERKNADTLVLKNAGTASDAGRKASAVVFSRSGFASWKVTGVELDIP